MDKLCISANELLDDSYRLGEKIRASGLKPDYIVGVWRGGTPVGIAVQEYLEYSGLPSDHISIRTSSYNGINSRNATVRVHGLGYIIDNINATDTLLIVDDVFDTGLSVEAIIEELEEKCRHNMPDVIKIATVYYKPEKRKTDRVPDYYIHESNDWLIFPHELVGLTPEEIKLYKSPVLVELVKNRM